jgi:thioredoxin reductase (NADPH)
MSDNEFDLIIIGAGPAGMAAAIYAARANLKVAIFEGSAPGGKMVNTHLVENYPGFKTASGADLALTMFNQVNTLGAKLVFKKVDSVKESGKFKIVTAGENEYKTKIVAIASGMKDRKLEIPGEDELYGKGVSNCVVCDGAFFKGKPIALIGGGNSAVEESIFASGFASKVYIVQLGDKLTAEQHIIDNVKKIKNIEVILNAKTKEITGTGKVEKLVYIDTKTDKEVSIEVSGVFPYIGFLPVTDFVKDLKVTDK